MKGTVFENIIAFTSKKCVYFGFASLFYLIFSSNVRKRLEATDYLEFCSYFHGHKLRTIK